jgi:hypothetical protein
MRESGAITRPGIKKQEEQPHEKASWEKNRCDPMATPPHIGVK